MVHKGLLQVLGTRQVSLIHLSLRRLRVVVAHDKRSTGNSAVANRRHVAAIKLLADGVQLTRRTSGYKGGQLSKSDGHAQNDALVAVQLLRGRGGRDKGVGGGTDSFRRPLLITWRKG
jgi:hypothetical protein